MTAGSYTFKATYTPDAGSSPIYSSAAGTASAAVVVSTPSFSLNQATIVITPATATSTCITPRSSATAVVTVSALNGYTGTVSLTCALTGTTASGGDGTTCAGGGSGAPINLATCGSNCSVTFTIGTTAPQTAALERQKIHKNNKGWLGAGSGAVLALVVFFGIPARRRSWRSMLGVPDRSRW